MNSASDRNWYKRKREKKRDYEEAKKLKEKEKMNRKKMSRGKKIALTSVTLVMTLLVTAGIIYYKKPEPLGTNPQCGNSVANLAGGIVGLSGVVVENGQHLFYLVDNGIVKLDKKTGEKNQIIETEGHAFFQCLNLIQDTLIFQWDESIYQCDLQGNNMKKRVSSRKLVSMYMVLDDWIYYETIEGIYRKNLNGKTIQLVKGTPGIMSLAGVDIRKKKLYLYGRNNPVYQCDLEQKSELKKVTDDIPFGSAVVEDEMVYYAEGFYTYQYNTNTQERKELIRGMGDAIIIYDKGKILYTSGSYDQLREYDVETGEDRLIYERAGKNIRIVAVFDDGLAINVKNQGEKNSEAKRYWMNRDGEILYELN